MSALIDELAARLGPGAVITDPDRLAPHLQEWRGRLTGHARALVAPASTEETALAVRLCAAAGAAITTQGGNTGLVGAQIPNGEILLSTKRMNRIRAVEPLDDALTVEAGVVLADAHAAAERAGRVFPLSLASQGSATIGGLISTNAGGVHVVRYGMMRDLVLGIEAVLPDGRVFNGLKTLRKDNTGYDLKQLFIGAEGTLGVVTAATLKLFPRPGEHLVAMARVASPAQALALLHRVKGETGALAAFEIMNRLAIDVTVKNVPGQRDPFPGAPFEALIELEGAARAGLRATAEAAFAHALEAGEAEDVVFAESQAQAQSFWALRENLSAGHRPEGEQINHDISVPVSAVPRFLEAAARAAEALCAGVRVVAFGHMGDGNIHYTLMAPRAHADAPFPALALSESVNALALSMGGSISAEHGIGVTRRDEFERFKDRDQIALMRTLKTALDPNRLMNPRALV